MQASFEAEARGKAEALKSKKKLEADINELEAALDGANRGRAESEKNVKKLQAAIKDAQTVRRRLSQLLTLMHQFASDSSQLLDSV